MFVIEPADMLSLLTFAQMVYDKHRIDLVDLIRNN